MSPLSRLFHFAFRYLLVGLFFLLLAVLVCPWGELFGPARGPLSWPLVGVFILVFLAGVSLSVGVAATAEVVPLLRYRGRPNDLLAQMKRDLDSPSYRKRRRALQVIADHLGHPFGRANWWPLVRRPSAAQVDNMTALYKECMRIAKVFRRDGTLCPHILGRMQSPAKFVLERALCGPPSPTDAPGRRPRPLSLLPDQLVAAMRGRVEDALRRVAAILSDPTAGRLAATEALVRDVLGDLVWDALDAALRLAIRAELAARENGAQTAGPLRGLVAEALDRSNDAVKDAILDLGAGDDEPAPHPERRPLPPVEPGRLAAALRETVERTLAALAGRVNAARDLEGVAACEQEVCDLFDDLAHHALELSAGMRVDMAADHLPWSGGSGEWSRKFRRMTAMESIVEPDQEP